MEKFIKCVCDGIVEQFSPEKIILFSRKGAPDDSLSSFKLCILTNGGDPEKIEHDIYMNIECDIPFDVLVYDQEDFNRMVRRSGSFAQRVISGGSVLYEK